MAGIYIHVPFCKVKCHYCDFHFSVQLNNKDRVMSAIGLELQLRKDYLEGEEVETIYFGGGTPSILNGSDFSELFNIIHENYRVSDECEVTVECNPDDLDIAKLEILRRQGVNRLSVGTQSFNDEVLKFMNRAHNSNQALNSIRRAKEIGFDNITLDLIYGVPGSSMESWKQELDQFLALEVPHLSAYCLTIEENTVFGNWYKKGKLNAFPDDESLKQFEYLMDFTAVNNFEHYEISNFSKEGYISKHNAAYWLGKKYLGIGPSAHSYNGREREWNIANNARYLKAVDAGELFSEKEVLSDSDRFNDYILTRLRTKWGIVVEDLEAISATKTQDCVKQLEGYVETNHLLKSEGTYVLTQKGKFISDAISADLFQ